MYIGISIVFCERFLGLKCSLFYSFAAIKGHVNLCMREFTAAKLHPSGESATYSVHSNDGITRSSVSIA